MWPTARTQFWWKIFCLSLLSRSSTQLTTTCQLRHPWCDPRFQVRSQVQTELRSKRIRSGHFLMHDVSPGLWCYFGKVNVERTGYRLKSCTSSFYEKDMWLPYHLAVWQTWLNASILGQHLTLISLFFSRTPLQHLGLQHHQRWVLWIQWVGKSSIPRCQLPCLRAWRIRVWQLSCQSVRRRTTWFRSTLSMARPISTACPLDTVSMWLVRWRLYSERIAAYCCIVLLWASLRLRASRCCCLLLDVQWFSLVGFSCPVSYLHTSINLRSTMWSMTWRRMMRKSLQQSDWEHTGQRTAWLVVCFVMCEWRAFPSAL